MKKKGSFAVIILLLVLGTGIWWFVSGVREHLWLSSTRTITESIHQGANALNIQFENGFNTLERIRQHLSHSGATQDILQLYKEVELDVSIYRPSGQPLQEGEKTDHTTAMLLQAESAERGILDAHINSITGENVFHIFIRGTLADGNPVFLVREYRTKEIADQFTLSFYDNTGFSYLINREGNIMVRPEHRNSNKTVINLFDMISEQENDPAVIQTFQESIQTGKTGWAKFLYNGTGMVFCYESLPADSGWLLVSIIPEHIITAETDNILRKTMTLSGTVIGIILIIVAFFYGVKMHENKIHTEELQTALEMADMANRTKGRFLMDMSHDILTPLNAILGMTAIAQENSANQSRVDDCLKKIKTSGTHLLTLVNDVLDLAQIEQGKTILKAETFYFPQLFDEIVGFLSLKTQETGVSLNLMPVRLKNETVTGDPMRIRQILMNIVSNAIKYTPSGGRITLELTQKEDSRKENGTYRFRCSDTGIGIEPEFLNRHQTLSLLIQIR